MIVWKRFVDLIGMATILVRKPLARLIVRMMST